MMLEVKMRSALWALRSDRLSALLDGLTSGDWPRAGPPPRQTQPQRSGIRILRLHGVLTQREMVHPIFGPLDGTALDQVGLDLKAAAADPAVDQVLLEIDSPGGEVAGVRELAALIRETRGSKPVVAIANSEASSAGYWLGAQADEFFATTGGMVGGVGVYRAHEDLSKAMEMEGVHITFISAGKYKVEGNPFAPLNEAARRHMQYEVDEVHNAMLADIGKGRAMAVDTVRRTFGQGRVLRPEQAKTAGMIDGVLTIDQVLQRMQRASRVTRPGANPAAMSPQMRHNHALLAIAEGGARQTGAMR